MELLADDAACALNGLGLVVVEAGGADQFFNGFDGGFGHGFRGWIGREEFGCDHVHAGVGALSGENGRNEELPCIFVDEGTFDVGVAFAEDLEDGFDAVGFDFEFGGRTFAGAWRGFGRDFAVGRKRFLRGLFARRRGFGGDSLFAGFLGGFFYGVLCRFRGHRDDCGMTSS